MKHPIPVGLLMLCIGIAIGWLAKPLPAPNVSPVASGVTPPPPPSKPVAAVESAGAPPLGKHALRDSVVKKPSNMMRTEAQVDQSKQMQSEMSKVLVKRQRAKFDQKIDRLTESLSLTADQKAKLTNWFDDGMKKLEGLDITESKGMTDIADLSKLLSPKSLEDQLASSLTAEQQTAFTNYKEREHHDQVDAAALKSLSKLQGVIQFEDGQRDEVYQILTKSAEASLLAKSETPDIAAMFTEDMGMEMDPYDLGLQQAMMESVGDPAKLQENAGDQKQIFGKLGEVIDKRIDAKVELLRPVLNDKQLEQYRTELKTKGMGVYGTVLSGLKTQDATPPASDFHTERIQSHRPK